jgi:hypothetical protein
MPNATLIAAVLLGMFVVWLAAHDRLKTYVAVVGL